MEDNTTTTTAADKQPATYADLKGCIPGVSADFICEAQEKSWTLDQAQSTWMERQQEEIAKLREDNEKAAKTVAGNSKSSTGVDPEEVADKQGKQKGKATQGDGDPIASFQQRFRARVKDGMEQAAAMKATIQEDPQAYEEYLSEYNRKHPNAHEAFKQGLGSAAVNVM